MKQVPLLVGLIGCLSPLCVSAQNSTSTSSAYPSAYTLQAENITAVFTNYGARLMSILVNDRNGTPQDVVPGYDNVSDFIRDTNTNHTYFGAVVGRYANRIKNHTFTLDGVSYDIPGNENDGVDTLHGGNVGYDQRNWTVLSSNESSVSFSLLDTGFEGFPGTVLNVATYSVGLSASGPQGETRPRLTTQLVSMALDQATPIMLSNHIYWTLNAFQAENLLNDTSLYMPYSTRYVQTDGILIPNGTIGLVSAVPALDFLSSKLFGDAIDEAAGLDLCGTGCQGIDNSFILDRPSTIGVDSVLPVLTTSSDTTGISMTMSTNQQGVQVYGCISQDGTIPVKPSQVRRNQGVQGATEYVQQYGCMAIEPQAWIDGVNHPEWGVQRYEIFTPQTPPAVNYATYDFSTF